MPVPPVIQMYRYVMGSGGGVSNLLLGSEELGSTGVGRWNQDLMNAVNSDQVNNPAGTEQTADQLDFQADKAARIIQDVTLVAGTEYTFSVWARAASGTQDFRLSYWDNVGRNFGLRITDEAMQYINVVDSTIGRSRALRVGLTALGAEGEEAKVVLENIFENLKVDLDKLDEKREYLLPITRDIVRICSEIIKSVHRNELDNIETQITQIKKLISSIQEKASDTLRGIGKNYLAIVYQEFTEAVTFYSLIKNNTIPHYSEIGVNPYEFLLGLTDLLGELKRMILNKIRNGDLTSAEFLYEHMEKIHEHLFGLDYPSGLLPGFRKKIDKTRGLLNSTLEIIVSSKQIHDFKTTLEHSSKQQDK